MELTLTQSLKPIQIMAMLLLPLLDLGLEIPSSQLKLPSLLLLAIPMLRVETQLLSLGLASPEIQSR